MNTKEKFSIRSAIFPQVVSSFRSHKEDQKGFTFLSEDGKTEQFFSFQEIARYAACYGAALKRNGLVRGDRVALVLPDSQQFIFSFLGSMHIGLVPVPLAPPLSFGQLEWYMDHIQHILEVSEAEILITSSQIKSVLGSLVGTVLKNILTVDNLSTDNQEAELAELNGDDLAFLQFTSGSTSKPKGVTLTYNNLSANAYCIANQGLQLNEQDKFCSWLPLFHDMGLFGFVITALFTGTPGVFFSPIAFIKRPLSWIRFMSQYKATLSYAPNFAYGLCAKKVKKGDLIGTDLSSWRVAGCGAEPIDVKTIHAFEEKFEQFGFNKNAFFPCYGMAESTLAVTFPSLTSPVKVDIINLDQLVSVNKAIPQIGASDPYVEIVCCGTWFDDHDLIIVDEKGNSLPERSVGEVLIKGPSLMKEYYNNPQATKEVLNDGWLKTGDTGYLVDKELYVCGRIKDLIIISGRNYYPTDIEWVVSKIPGVRAGNIVAFGLNGLGDEKEKVVVCAEVKLKSEEFPRLLNEIRSKILEQVGLRVSEIILLPAGVIPKTSSGKVQRSKVKQLYLKGKLNDRKRVSKVAILKHLASSQWSLIKHKMFS